MVSALKRVGGEKTGKLTEIEEEALGALRQMKEDGKDLSGLRCGTAVCGRLSELEDRGLVSIRGVERDGEAWELDLNLEDAI